MINKIGKSGSTKTDLWTPESDLNICVVIQKNSLSNSYIFSQINRFYEFLEKKDTFIAKITAEEKKNIFVVKTWLTQKFAHLKVEIIFKMFFFENTVRNEYFVFSYMQVYKWLKPLYLIFRRVLHVHQLDDPETGGINTFSIFLMIVGFLQKIESQDNKKSSPVNDVANTSFRSMLSGSTRVRDKYEISFNLSAKNAANLSNLGELFLNLLYFYAYSFDYSECFIKPYVVENSSSVSVMRVTLKEKWV